MALNGTGDALQWAAWFTCADNIGLNHGMEDYQGNQLGNQAAVLAGQAGVLGNKISRD